MSGTEKKFRIGSIISTDITVPNADELLNFYQDVVGWTAKGLDMGGYDDYLLSTADGEELVGGVCHSRGINKDLPPVWLVYINVEDVEASASRCVELGGRIVTQSAQYAVIQDPAGAYLGIAREPGEPPA